MYIVWGMRRTINVSVFWGLNEKGNLMPVDLNLLEQLDIFDGLEHRDLKILKVLFSLIRVREGELLTRRGDPAQNF